MLATVYPYLGKKGKHPRTVGVRREGEKLLDKKILVESDLKLFRKILTLGEWAPLFFGAFQPYPLSISPRGFHVKPCLAWHGLGLALIGMAWHGSGHGLGHGLVSYPTDRSVN
jgi:hypothetical protein